MYALNSMRRRKWGALQTFYRGRSFPAFYPSGEYRKNVFYTSQNHRILIEWEIFKMNSSEFNEPCHEIHQNSNSDNSHQETNC